MREKASEIKQRGFTPSVLASGPPTPEPTLTHSPPNSSKRHAATAATTAATAWFKIESERGSEWASWLDLTLRQSRCCCQVQEARYESKDGVSRWRLEASRRGRQHFPQNMSSAISLLITSATKQNRFKRGERAFGRPEARSPVWPVLHQGFVLSGLVSLMPTPCQTINALVQILKRDILQPHELLAHPLPTFLENISTKITQEKPSPSPRLSLKKDLVSEGDFPQSS